MLRSLPLVWIVTVVALLSGCQAAADAPGPTEPSGVLAGLPSLSELSGTPAAEPQPQPTLDPDEIDLGRELYAVHCASCHGPQLQGEANWQTQNEDGSFRAPAHDASGHTWHHSDSLLLETVRLGGARLPEDIGGSSTMPAFAEILDERQMAAVLAYIKSTWPQELRQIQWQQSIGEP